MKVYAVDLVIDIVKAIGGADPEPVMFHRDGHLYVATENGFGAVRTGISAVDWKLRGSEQKELAESRDALKSGGRCMKGMKFIKGESAYFNPVLFGPDHPTFSLESMAQTARDLGELDDDGLIRLVRHETSYKSHKYGYGADGVNVHLSGARVMDRERYLQIARENQDKTLERMERLALELETMIPVGRLYAWAQENYGFVQFPDCVVLTPYIFASFPCEGKLISDRGEQDVWTTETDMVYADPKFSDCRNTIDYMNPLDYFKESPFAMKLAARPHVFRTVKEVEFVRQQGEFMEGVGRHAGGLSQMGDYRGAVSHVMPRAEKLFDRLNELHAEIVKQMRRER
jgi:hypothetical protein